jgi:hypothetical protein
MNCQEIGTRYIIAWSTNKLVAIVNMTEDDRRQVMRIIMDDPEQHHWSNPIRDLIVYGVSNRMAGFELWEVESPLDEATIRLEFVTSADPIKSEIRQHGTLLYSS